MFTFYEVYYFSVIYFLSFCQLVSFTLCRVSFTSHVMSWSETKDTILLYLYCKTSSLTTDTQRRQGVSRHTSIFCTQQNLFHVNKCFVSHELTLVTISNVGATSTCSGWREGLFTNSSCDLEKDEYVISNVCQIILLQICQFGHFCLQSCLYCQEIFFFYKATTQSYNQACSSNFQIFSERKLFCLFSRWQCSGAGKCVKWKVLQGSLYF